MYLISSYEETSFYNDIIVKFCWNIKNFQPTNVNISVLGVYIYLCLYIYTYIWPPWTLNMLNIVWWCSMPREEAKRALGSVHIVYCCYIISTAWSPSLHVTMHILVSSPFFLHHHPETRKIQPHLIPPLIGDPWAHPLLPIQIETEKMLCRDVLCNHILAPGDVSLHRLQAHWLQGIF